MTTPKIEKPTLLMAEDDNIVADMLRFLLEREGYKVLRAADGRRALQLIDEITPPQLVLLDIMLPYVDGFQLVTHIRSKPEWRGVPILMLTAYANDHDIVRALDAGANDYVPKPFKPDELMARLRRFLKSPM